MVVLPGETENSQEVIPCKVLSEGRISISETVK